jgi:hypothetical protein
MGMDVRQQLLRVAEASSSIEHRLATRRATGASRGRGRDG